jgi:membrane protein
MSKLARTRAIAKQTVLEYIDDDGLQMSAALAFYSVLSLAPTLVLVISVAGFVWDTAPAQAEVVRQVTRLVGPRAAELVHVLLDNTGDGHNAQVATVTGIALVVAGATAVFADLQSALNKIWKATPPKSVVRAFLQRRLMSSLIVFVLAILLMTSVLATAAITLAAGALGLSLHDSEFVDALVQLATSYSALAAVFAAMYKLLPRAKTSWRHAWIGAALTAGLFLIGKALVQIYVENASLTSSHGAVGSVIAFLLWIYYSAIIFFFGAEVTSVLHRRSMESKAC